MSKVCRVYLDNAATTPVDRRVLKVMSRCLKEKYGNPSSLHLEGRTAKAAIERSRSKIAEIIGASPKEIVFTSGGTESDNLAILGIAGANQDKGRHIITSKIEHKAVLDACRLLAAEGFEITYLDVDSDGQISVKQLKDSLRPDTILVSVMYANNEIGSIQPINEIANVIKQSKISSPIFHTDACQASGALLLNVNDLGIDAMTISSSKIYGPKGVGCLYVKTGIKINPIMLGGGQERGFRSGTENVAGIVGFGEALTIADDKRPKEAVRLSNLRDYLLQQINLDIKDVTVNGGMKNRLPNNLNISIRGVEGESLVLMLDNMGIACSTGSACSSADLNPSHVLLQIGLPVELAHCSVRFSLGRKTTKKDVDYLLKSLPEVVNKIRRISSIR